MPTCVFVPLPLPPLDLSQPASTSSLLLGLLHPFIHSVSQLVHSFTNALTRHSQSLHLLRNHRHNHRISISIPNLSCFSCLPGPSGLNLSNPLLNEWQLSHLTATLLASLDTITSRLLTSCTSPQSLCRKRRPPLRFLWVVHRCTSTHNSLRHYSNLDQHFTCSLRLRPLFQPTLPVESC
jgi:hypothetical protein